MKRKVIGTCLLMCAVFLLTGCQSKEAKAVDQAIAAIGEVTLESESVIQDARVAYDRLSGEDKDSLKNTAALEEAELQLEVLQIQNAIEDLPRRLSFKNKDDLDQLRERYEDLPDVWKEEVENYSALEQAYEKMYASAYETAEIEREDGNYIEAYEIYEQLPDGYEDSAALMDEIRGFVMLAKARQQFYGTWEWDGNNYITEEDNIPADFQLLTFSEGSLSSSSLYEDSFMCYVHLTPVDKSLQPETIRWQLLKEETTEFDTLAMADDSDDTEGEALEPEWASLYSLDVSGDVKTGLLFRLTYHLLKDGRLRMDYTVFHVYSKTGFTVPFYYERQS